MAKGLLSVLYAVVAIALQGILGHLGLADRFIPQFLVIFVVYLSFAEANAFGCVMSFIVGLLLDLSSAVLVGGIVCCDLLCARAPVAATLH